MTVKYPPDPPALPSRLYVRQKYDGKSFFFVADLDRDELVESEVTVIGEYELVNTVKVKLVPQIVS